MNFTKKSLEALPVKAQRHQVWDDQIPGLGVIVFPSGVKSFYWYRRVRGKLIWRTIGSIHELSVEQARARAQEFNVENADWKSRRYEGTNPFSRAAKEPTLNDIIEDYCNKRLADHAKHPEKAAKAARWARDKYLSTLKNRRLSAIEKKDIADLHRSIGKAHGKVTANRMATLLKTLFNWARKAWAWEGHNPAQFVEKYRETARTRSLQGDERKVFIEALAAEHNRDLRDFLILAVFTGARAGDILSMRWQDITEAVWLIPDPKNRRPLEVHLVEEALNCLSERKNDSVWVFPSKDSASGHLTTVKKGWKQFTKRTKLTGLTVHDLRRTHGTIMEEAGVPISVISKVLGHSSTGVTERYLQAGKKSRQEAVQKGTRLLGS
jgi:integrase